MDRGIYLSQTEAENTTLKEAEQRYLTEVTPSKRSADQEATRIRKWMKHPLTLKSLASLRSTDFATYRDKRLEQVKGNTIRLELAVISHLFRIANTEWGMESLRNPIKKIGADPDNAL